MRRIHPFVLATAVLGSLLGPVPATAGSLGRYEVFGVEGEDMLKMRAGPGIGYIVILGLPNGTAVRVHDCQSTGGTRWCSISLEKARGLKGFVSFAYLRKM